MNADNLGQLIRIQPEFAYALPVRPNRIGLPMMAHQSD